MTVLLDPSRDLEDIAWDFTGDLSPDRDRLKLFDARKHHWYPATYIPELPFTLIELLSRPGDRVFDPFAGIGTTMWQARLLGRVPFGIDSCTVAYRLAAWFSTLLQPHVDFRAVSSGVREIVSGYRAGAHAEGIDDVRTTLLRPWYSDGTFDQIAYLMTATHRDMAEPTRAAINIATSALLKPMCEQRNGWGCIADNMMPGDTAAAETRPFLDRLLRRVGLLCRDVRRVQPALDSAGIDTALSKVTLAHGSVIDPDTPVPNNVDLIVTSPPYPGMTDYATSQRLSYYWLGLEPKPDVHIEIGARRKRFASGWIDRYVHEMRLATTRMARSLKRGGYFCMVLPNFSLTREGPDPRLIAVENVLEHMASIGQSRVWSGHRLLPSDRRHLNPNWTRLEKEKIVVFRKDGP